MQDGDKMTKRDKMPRPLPKKYRTGKITVISGCVYFGKDNRCYHCGATRNCDE